MKRDAALAWRIAIVVGYVSRPCSCGEALALETRPPDDPYHSVDPHGFGVMGAFIAALLLAGPVLALLLQQRPDGGGHADRGAATRWRDGVALAAIGSPMLMQLSYLRLPLSASWPVLASSAAWLGLVASVVLHRGVRGPSLQGAFDRRPAVAWTVLIAIALLKIVFAAYAWSV